MQARVVGRSGTDGQRRRQCPAKGEAEVKQKKQKRTQEEDIHVEDVDEI